MAISRKPLVEYLIERGYLRPEQRDEALKVQQQTKTSDIGRVLVDLGFVGEREVTEGIAQEQGLGFVDLDRINVESSALNVVPERIARNHTVIPVKKEGATLFVATSNPNNIVALDDIQLASGCRAVPVLAVRGAIEDAIQKYYGGQTSGNGAGPAAGSPSAVISMRGDISQAIAEAGASRNIAVEEDEEVAAQVAEQAPIIRLANALVQQAIVLLERRVFKAGPRLERPAAVRDYLRLKLVAEPNEIFVVVFMNSMHDVLAVEPMFHGTINATSVYPRVVLQR
ncbi:hypothetical protein FCG40_10050, partial [Fimbriimonadia bacterium ATM]|nr:hypothetical protein [Fimbriimonadia bacterium ATM]